MEELDLYVVPPRRVLAVAGHGATACRAHSSPRSSVGQASVHKRWLRRARRI
jgi:hypothetical protein